MLLDIDKIESVIESVETIAWFDVRKLYKDLKTDNETHSINFWNITEHLLRVVSVRLGQSQEAFIDYWRNRCLAIGVEIMGYHCTRIHDPQIFRNQGIIPLNENSLETFFSLLKLAFPTFLLPDRQKQELIQIIKDDSIWKYRAGTGAGPYFFLSCRSARNPDNSFYASGTEIWWLFVDILIKYCHDKQIWKKQPNFDHLR
jgi:hypothetical protein